MVSKNKPVDRITLLLQSGLAKDTRRIPYYRDVLRNPKSSFNNTVYRDLAGELLETLTNYVLNDSQLFNRLRASLLADNRKGYKTFEALIAKAEDAGIPVDVIIEVYHRGLEQTYPLTLTPEQRGFNRVNSFIAGGSARDVDADLLEAPSDREEGTTSLATQYAKDTPGQTLKTVRRIIRNKNG